MLPPLCSEVFKAASRGSGAQTIPIRHSPIHRTLGIYWYWKRCSGRPAGLPDLPSYVEEMSPATGDQCVAAHLYYLRGLSLISTGSHGSGAAHCPPGSPARLLKQLLFWDDLFLRGCCPQEAIAKPAPGAQTGPRRRAALLFQPLQRGEIRGYWFLPCSDCTRPSCSHVPLLSAGSSALRGSNIPAQSTREQGKKVPGGAALFHPSAPGPGPPAKLSSPRIPATSTDPKHAPTQGVRGPAPKGSSEQGSATEERRRVGLTSPINTLYSLEKAQS